MQNYVSSDKVYETRLSPITLSTKYLASLGAMYRACMNIRHASPCLPWPLNRTPRAKYPLHTTQLIHSMFNFAQPWKTCMLLISEMHAPQNAQKFSHTFAHLCAVVIYVCATNSPNLATCTSLWFNVFRRMCYTCHMCTCLKSSGLLDIS